MRDTIVGRHIRRASWNVILANALLLGGVVVLFVATKTYWVNFVSGPFPIGWEELVALPNADGLQHYYVRIAGDRVVPTGVQTIEKTVSKWTNQVKQRVTADYAAVEIAGRWLVVKHAPDNPPGRSVVGTLQTAPGDVRERIMLAAERELRAPGLFLPLLLNTTGFHGRGHFMLAIGVPVALLAAWNLARASGRVRHPENHPAARRLGAFGSPGDVAGQIDAETASPDQFARVGKVVITKSWLLVPKTYGLTIRRLGDAVWAYKSMTQRRVNGIPTGKTHAAVCYFTDGTMETVPARTERAAEELVMAIQQRAPWLLVGYDPQVEALWWLKRGEVLATLEERRKHLVGQVGGNSAPS